MPVEVDNSTIESHLPVEAKEKRAIVESIPSPVEVNDSIIELHLPVEAKEDRAIIESKVKPLPLEVNNSIIELWTQKKVNHTASCDIDNQRTGERTMFDGKRLSRSTQFFWKSTALNSHKNNDTFKYLITNVTLICKLILDDIYNIVLQLHLYMIILMIFLTQNKIISKVV